MGMDGTCRLHVIHEFIAVELIIFILCNIFFILLPQRNHGIQGILGINGFIFRLIILRCILRLRLCLRMRHQHFNRITDIIGILAYQTGQAIGLQEFIIAFRILSLRIRLDGQDDIGTIGFLFARLNRKAICAVRFPDISLVTAACLGNHLDMGSHHEGCIEAYTELTDDVRILCLIFLLECQRTALCNGTQIGFQFLTGHTDTVIRNGQGTVVLIHCQMDFKSAFRYQRSIGQGTEMPLVNGVTCVGDQLTQENFLMCVDRVNHHVQQTFGFCLKLLLCHSV